MYSVLQDAILELVYFTNYNCIIHVMSNIHYIIYHNIYKNVLITAIIQVVQ